MDANIFSRSHFDDIKLMNKDMNLEKFSYNIFKKIPLLKGVGTRKKLSRINALGRKHAIFPPLKKPIALNNMDWGQVFEPARFKTTRETHVFTETADKCDLALAAVM